MADPTDETKKERASGEGESDAEGEGASSSSEPASSEPASAEAKSKPAKKKSQSAEGSEPGEIRDRNRRIREEAAAKRRAKRESEERRAAPARNLEASEIVDDALARTTHAAAGWLKRHSNTIQWAVVVLAVGGIGYQIYSYRRGINVANATEELAKALAAEHARVGEGSASPDRFTGLTDTRPAFPNDEQRLKAAEAEYRKAKQGTSGMLATLAQLGLAGILFDAHKYTEAKAAYDEVKGSDLAAKDKDVKARAIEGVGQSLEELGQDDAALKAFRELENLEVPAFSALGQYHQARILVRKGERDKAKEILKKASEKLSKLEDKDKKGPMAAPGYLTIQVKELLSTIDPTAVEASSGPSFTPEQLKQLQEQMKGPGGQMDAKKLQDLLKSMQGMPQPPGPEGPIPEGPTPEAPTPEAPAPQAPAPAPAAPAPTGSAP